MILNKAAKPRCRISECESTFLFMKRNKNSKTRKAKIARNSGRSSTGAAGEQPEAPQEDQAPEDGAKEEQTQNLQVDPAIEAEHAEREEEMDFPPYDNEAWAYMTTAIPGAYQPIFYVGPTVSIKIAKMLGRSLTLEEAMHLVSIDGDIAVCGYSEERLEFQPIKYLPFVPKILQSLIEKDIPLTEIDLPYGGAYYLTKDKQLFPVSGSVFKLDRRQERYVLAKTSPLVIMAERSEGVQDKRKWGDTLEVANRKRGVHLQQNRRNERADKLWENLLLSNNNKRGGNRRSPDEFTRLQGRTHRNGKPVALLTE